MINVLVKSDGFGAKREVLVDGLFLRRTNFIVVRRRRLGVLLDLWLFGTTSLLRCRESLLRVFNIPEPSQQGFSKSHQEVYQEIYQEAEKFKWHLTLSI